MGCAVIAQLVFSFRRFLLLAVIFQVFLFLFLLAIKLLLAAVFAAQLLFVGVGIGVGMLQLVEVDMGIQISLVVEADAQCRRVLRVLRRLLSQFVEDGACQVHLRLQALHVLLAQF
mmetsp:Transcript_26670/g.33275  ORF Transcript_26670/g.33275 Transcript_26670/m.33275 type:complete len:116 (-) Transcript_26670:79-426(-)